ncbi:MAG: glycosyltransferase [Scrofimicrobium sp.]
MKATEERELSTSSVSTPSFTLVLPVDSEDSLVPDETIKTVLEQSFNDWEMILVITGSGTARTSKHWKQLREDRRVRLIRAEEASAVASLNAAVKRSTGEWIIPIDGSMQLRPNALEVLQKAASETPIAGLIYSDEGEIDDRERRKPSDQKPSWSPERLRHGMYLGNFVAFRRDLTLNVDMYRQEFEGVHNYDLALRISETTADVAFVPAVLCYRFMATEELSGLENDEQALGRAAIQEHLNRIELESYEVVDGPRPGTYSLKRPFDPETRVSVVIPTRGGSAEIRGQERVLVTHTVRSLMEHTTHQNLEVVIVFDADTPQSVLAELESICSSKLVPVRYERPFNFSEKCNLGFAASSGNIVVFLNDDMEIVSDRFIEDLCAPLQEKEVGATGARLIFENGTIQHAGVIAQRGNFMHAYAKWADDSAGYCDDLLVDHEVSMVTGACLALRRETFEQVGRFDEQLPSNFNDVDLCLKIRSEGMRVIWLSQVRAFHFESLSRDNTVTRPEVKLMAGRWPRTSRDPYMPQESQRLIKYVQRTRVPRKLLSLYRRARRQLRQVRSHDRPQKINRKQ